MGAILRISAFPYFYIYVYRNVYKKPFFTFSFLKTILGKKTHNTPICVYGVFERLGIDLTEYTDTRAGKKEKHIVLVMEDYFSRWVVFHAKDASCGKITLNGYQIFVGQDYYKRDSRRNSSSVV